MKSIKKNITLFNVTLLSLIFVSGGIQVFSIVVSTLIPTILLIILYLKNNTYVHNAIIPALFFIVSYLLYAVFIANDMEDIKFVFFRSVRFIMAILLLNFIYIKRINFIDALNSVLYWLTIHGLVNYVIVLLFFQYFTLIPGTNTHSFLFFFGTESLENLIPRSQGIFWEPGVFQIYLNIFLFINLFYVRKLNLLLITIILISIFLTLSTTGIFISSFLLSYYFIKQIKYNKLYLIFLTLPLSLIIISFANNQIAEKTTGIKKGSFLARNYDTITGFNLAIDNPWGIGFSTYKYQKFARNDVFNLTPGLDTDRGNTNSIATLFYSTGFLWGFVFLYFMYNQSLFRENKILFYISIIIFLLAQPLLYTPFFILILLSGLISSKKQLAC